MTVVPLDYQRIISQKLKDERCSQMDDPRRIDKLQFAFVSISVFDHSGKFVFDSRFTEDD